MAAVQRVRQGLRALFAFSKQVDYPLAEQYLSAKQMTLFCQMSKSEQLHSLNVLRDVLAQSPHTPRDLAVAALLHDVGKMRCRLTIWEKSFGVLMRWFAPGLFRRWAERDTIRWWMRPAVVMVHHPAWSVEEAQAVETSSTALWLIAHHADAPEQWHQHPNHDLLRRLKQADDAN